MTDLARAGISDQRPDRPAFWPQFEVIGAIDMLKKRRCEKTEEERSKSGSRSGSRRRSRRKETKAQDEEQEDEEQEDEDEDEEEDDEEQEDEEDEEVQENDEEQEEEEEEEEGGRAGPESECSACVRIAGDVVLIRPVLERRRAWAGQDRRARG